MKSFRSPGSRFGFGAVIKSIRDLEHRIGYYAAGKFLDRLGKTVVNSARQNAPKDTGALRQSIKLRRRVRVTNGQSHTVEVTVSYGEGLTPNYAPIVEFGTIKKFYTILPIRHKMLHWRPKPGNLSTAWVDKKGWVHAKKVTKHPGQLAQPFLGPALARAEAEIKPQLDRVIDRELHRFVRGGIIRVNV